MEGQKDLSGAQGLEQYSTAFPSHKQMAESDVEQLEHK